MPISLFLDARTAGPQLPHMLHALGHLARQWPGGYELLLVDDTENESLASLAQQYHATLVTSTAPTLGCRFNTAVAASQGRVLLFPGSVGQPLSTWLGQRLATVEGEREWDVAVLLARPPRPLMRWFRWLQRASPLDTFWVARTWFERIGGCDPQLDSEALPDLLERLRACQARVSIEIA